ncbi:SNF2 family N-terminal domain-containing protein [Chlamydoabsidia padenii]|nr:SNF2 family N-terminal domain-containing protein [Chlamydoabsidia padenii]
MPYNTVDARLRQIATSSSTTYSNNGDNVDEPSVKRRKGETLTTIGQIALPFYCATPSLIDTLNDKHLQAHWSFRHIPGVGPLAALKVVTVADQQLVLENEVSPTLAETISSNESNSKSDTIKDTKQLFIHLARLCSQTLVTTLNITLEHNNNNNNNCVAILTLGANIESKSIRGHLFNLIIPYLYPIEHSPTGMLPIDDFYRHLQPPVSSTLLKKCHAQGLEPTLSPFQSQNVEWMVNREGFSILDDGTLQENTRGPDQTPYLWEKVNATTTGQHLYINRITQKICSSWAEELESKRQKMYRGGILADEMGLGKTVSTIALILINSAEKSNVYDRMDDPELTKTGATLIITPGTIIHQWESEFRRHAPGLQTTIYSGIKSIPLEMETKDYADTLVANDIVLTTYEVLSTEVNFSRITPDRPRRFDIKRKAKRSPLVQILWWRCVLDEAQQVKSSVSQTAEMACLIPRYYSWGITGTPLKSSNYDDLYGLFIFLDQFNDIKPIRYRHLYSSLQPLFLDFTKQLMRRNMKCFLQSQIHIPKQHRHVIKISFSTIEQHYYNDSYEKCRQEANLDWLESIGWEEPTDMPGEMVKYNESKRKLRHWLTDLRETCVYPAVLGKNQEATQPKSLDQVLKTMIQMTKEVVEEAQVTLANRRLAYGGMHELAQDDWKIPLSIYMEWLPRVEEQVKVHGARLTKARDTNSVNKQQHESDRGSSKNKDDKNKDGKIVAALHNTYTNWLNILHQYYFYIAGVHHMLEDKEKEDEYYDKAADIRRQILTRLQEKVNASINDVVETMTPHLTPGQMLVSFSPQKETILLTDDFLMRVDNVTEVMNQQIEVIDKWRTMLLAYLTSELVDANGDDVQGDEYDISLITQQKCDLYQDLYQDILRDRHYWVNGVWQAPRITNSQEEKLDDNENEEIKHLRVKLVQLRQKIAPNGQSSDNLRLLLAELRETASGPNTMHKVEQHLIQTELTRLTRELRQQKDLQETLESEYRKLSGLANHRIEYYKGLQQISDHVKVWECQHPDTEIQYLRRDIAALEDEISTKSSRQRYLENIAQEKQGQQDGDDSNQEMFCLICNEHFISGIVTYCGHLYCDVCANAWFKTSRRCPQCSSTVKRKEWYSISWSRATLQQDGRTQQQDENSSDTQQKNNPSSGGLTNTILSEIGQVHIKGGLGAKLDNIVRHIKYIQQTNNGKCLVFSQWNRLLEMMSKGLTNNGLGHVSLTTGKKDNIIQQFRSDPSINVMLLHARSHSSGLTLLEAKTVFIIEPVLNDSLEKQAIGRVHRIGQTEETSVFWYIVRDTIEERIQDIHNAKQRHRQIASIDGMEMDSTTKPPLISKGGGEYVTDDDLRKCFTQEKLDVD